jgi:hypothetical protein
MRIPYQDESEKWSSLQIDFIILSRRDDGTLAASIVDPHGDYLADAKSKLRALADFAETYQDCFLRIQSVTEVEDGRLRCLDLLEDSVTVFVAKPREPRSSSFRAPRNLITACARSPSNRSFGRLSPYEDA